MVISKAAINRKANHVQVQVNVADVVGHAATITTVPKTPVMSQLAIKGRHKLLTRVATTNHNERFLAK